MGNRRSFLPSRTQGVSVGIIRRPFPGARLPKAPRSSVRDDREDRVFSLPVTVEDAIPGQGAGPMQAGRHST